MSHYKRVFFYFFQILVLLFPSFVIGEPLTKITASGFKIWNQYVKYPSTSFFDRFFLFSKVDHFRIEDSVTQKKDRAVYVSTYMDSHESLVFVYKAWIDDCPYFIYISKRSQKYYFIPESYLLETTLFHDKQNSIEDLLDQKIKLETRYDQAQKTIKEKLSLMEEKLRQDGANYDSSDDHEECKKIKKNVQFYKNEIAQHTIPAFDERITLFYTKKINDHQYQFIETENQKVVAVFSQKKGTPDFSFLDTPSDIPKNAFLLITAMLQRENASSWIGLKQDLLTAGKITAITAVCAGSLYLIAKMFFGQKKRTKNPPSLPHSHSENPPSIFYTPLQPQQQVNKEGAKEKKVTFQKDQEDDVPSSATRPLDVPRKDNDRLDSLFSKRRENSEFLQSNALSARAANAVPSFSQERRVNRRDDEGSNKPVSASWASQDRSSIFSPMPSDVLASKVDVTRQTRVLEKGNVSLGSLPGKKREGSESPKPKALSARAANAVPSFSQERRVNRRDDEGSNKPVLASWISQDHNPFSSSMPSDISVLQADVARQTKVLGKRFDSLDSLSSKKEKRFESPNPRAPSARAGNRSFFPQESRVNHPNDEQSRNISPDAKPISRMQKLPSSSTLPHVSVLQVDAFHQTGVSGKVGSKKSPESPKSMVRLNNSQVAVALKDTPAGLSTQNESSRDLSPLPRALKK